MLHMKIAVLWVVMPRSLVNVYWRFRAACAFITTLMMEGANISEMSINFYQTTWHNNPKDSMSC